MQPYVRKDIELTNRCYALLTKYPGLSWLAVTIPIADRAAELRARHRLATPDAIQIATALVGGATGFIGNDRKLCRTSEIECLILDDVT